MAPLFTINTQEIGTYQKSNSELYRKIKMDKVLDIDQSRDYF